MEDVLPQHGPLVLVLGLDDVARGSDDRPVRIVSADGRRLDTTVSPVSGEGSGVRLEIDPTFLSAGLYMIEVDSADSHALNLRRFVLELR